MASTIYIYVRPMFIKEKTNIFIYYMKNIDVHLKINSTICWAESVVATLSLVYLFEFFFPHLTWQNLFIVPILKNI